ncbi:hypothetical protein DdX_12663 [Ditylenchus destructor]|uniref:Uncharacterized protein n=1 Tax=Ditylenchus destructor TaxID=166010 RepID=A0AAD4MW14_9BILA|nr:hypothetical protein DdX_12663 [Ditylenchus destructor]
MGKKSGTVRMHTTWATFLSITFPQVSVAPEKESEVPAPDAHPEGHQKKDHNPNMEIAEKLDDIRYKLWDVLASVYNSSLRGICFEVIDKTEKLAEEIKKDQKMSHQDMLEKAESALSRIPDLKPALQFCAERKDAKVTKFVNELDEMTNEILERSTRF